jgi:hypothetical protein
MQISIEASRKMIAALGLLLSLACNALPAPTGPSSVVHHWLQAVAGAAADRGWSMLHPELRREMFNDDEHRYLQEAAASDRSGLRYQFIEEYWDDPGFGVARVHIDDVDRLPPFLTSRHGAFVFVSLRLHDEPPRGWNAEFAVKRNGAVSIFAWGG